MAYDPSLVLDMRSMMPFMDGATQRVRDFSGRGNNGTPTSFAGDDSEYVSGDMGQEIEFNGGVGNKYLNCGTDASLNAPGQVCVEAIFSVDSIAANHIIVSKADAGNTAFSMIVLNTPVVNFYCGSAAGANAASTPYPTIAGNKVHVIGQHDGVNTSIYVNGIWRANSAAPLPPGITAGAVRIGLRYDGGLPLDGRIARIRIFSRAMGATEIYNRYINRFRV